MRSGAEAERIGLVSLYCEREVLHDRALEVATSLASGARSAIRWTPHTRNPGERIMSPTLDASLGDAFLGCSGPEVAEGLASLREKRGPVFRGPMIE